RASQIGKGVEMVVKRCWFSRCDWPQTGWNIINFITQVFWQLLAAAVLCDLAGNHRVFIERVHRTHPMVSVGNDHFTIGRISYQKQRRHSASGLYFYL